jgi:hypothetical protein
MLTAVAAEMKIGKDSGLAAARLRFAATSETA